MQYRDMALKRRRKRRLEARISRGADPAPLIMRAVPGVIRGVDAKRRLGWRRERLAFVHKNVTKMNRSLWGGFACA